MIERETRPPMPYTSPKAVASEPSPPVCALSGEEVLPPALRPLSSSRALSRRALLNRTRPESSRCCRKGCVFPAAVGRARCWHHELEELEPLLFLSCQPTHVIVDRARFGLREAECEDSRGRDRRRLAALREQFLEDVA